MLSVRRPNNLSLQEVVEWCKERAIRSGDCLLYPWSLTWGYPGVTIKCKTYRLHRLVWIAKHGPITDPSLDVCHKCDTRHCIEEAHLFLGTRLDNMQDAARKGRIYTPVLKGELNGSVVLTAASVLDMREKYATGKFTQESIAQEHGVDRSTVGYIVRRKIWPHI